MTAVPQSKEIKVPAPRQLPSGNWFIQMRLDGKSVSVTEESESLCRAKAIAVKAGLIEQKKKEPKKEYPTLAQVFDEYIDDNEAVLSPSTIRGYAIIRRNRFKSCIDKPINEINYQRMVSDEAKAKAAKTVVNAWGLVSASFKYKGYPVPDVNLPTVVQEEKDILSASEMKTLISALEGKDFEFCALLCLHGLRISEVKDISKPDVEPDIVHVRGAAVPDRYNHLVHKKANKNKASRRDVPIFLPRVYELASQMPDDGYLVTKSETNLLLNVNKLCAENGLPEVGLHGLRHSFASFALCTLGIPLTSVMKLGGWSTPATLQKIYAHYLNEERKKDAQKMADFFAVKT